MSMCFHGIILKTTLLRCFDSGGDIEMWEDKWRSKMGDQKIVVDVAINAKRALRIWPERISVKVDA